MKGVSLLLTESIKQHLALNSSASNICVRLVGSGVGEIKDTLESVGPSPFHISPGLPNLNVEGYAARGNRTRLLF
jgi:hypothetical protein